MSFKKYSLSLCLLLTLAVNADVHPKNKASTSSVTLKRFSTGAVISNGLISMGVNDTGSLVYDNVGIIYKPTGGDGLVAGCECESWGVADAGSGRYGQAGENSGEVNLVGESFTSTATTAKSVVKVVDSTGDLFRVTHDFQPSDSPNLMKVAVTIENISGGDISDLRYRRAMDWDIPPDVYNELVTIVTDDAESVLYTSDDGFASGNPLATDNPILFTGEAVDSGPADHGALFDLGFGELAAGDKFNFEIFYGAVERTEDVIPALKEVRAENVYSLGKPNPAAVGVADGSPNTFVFAFKGVKGAPLTPLLAAPKPVPIPVVVLLGLSVVFLLLSVLGLRRSKI